ncbi:MAG: hypothetical protein GVY19_09885 [Bacteroidetes bacterium]|jgi:hypothetical protein|nr:hypothetical protein [Bacteroidota bacterium]
MRLFVIIVLLASIFFGNCKQIEKRTMFKKGIDTLLENNRQKDSIIYADSVKMAELQQMNKHLNLTIDSLKSLYENDHSFDDNKFYMIVGSFQNENYADMWAEKIGHMGYNTQIVMGRNGFNMVAAKSYNNLRAAVDDIDDFRSRIVDNAWVYVKN